jgi:hypothetical protein
MGNHISPHNSALVAAASDLRDFYADNNQEILIPMLEAVESGPTPDLVQSLICDEAPPGKFRDLKGRFDAVYMTLLDELRPRIETLATHTLLSESEALVFLLHSVPTDRVGSAGLSPVMCQIVFSRYSEGQQLVGKDEIRTLLKEAIRKVETAAYTRYLTQFLGHPPDEFEDPAEVSKGPRLPTIPIRFSTLRELRRRQRHSSNGTTLDDVISNALAQSVTIRSVSDFIQKYMAARPAAGVAILTNQLPDQETDQIRLEGIVESDHCNPPAETTNPIRGVHQSLNPHWGTRPSVVERTDRVSINGHEYTLEFGESVGYDPEYMSWIYTSANVDSPHPDRPEIGLDEGVSKLERIIGIDS